MGIVFKNCNKDTAKHVFLKHWIAKTQITRITVKQSTVQFKSKFQISNDCQKKFSMQLKRLSVEYSTLNNNCHYL